GKRQALLARFASVPPLATCIARFSAPLVMDCEPPTASAATQQTGQQRRTALRSCLRCIAFHRRVPLDLQQVPLVLLPANIGGETIFFQDLPLIGRDQSPFPYQLAVLTTANEGPRAAKHV